MKNSFSTVDSREYGNVTNLDMIPMITDMIDNETNSQYHQDTQGSRNESSPHTNGDQNQTRR